MLNSYDGYDYEDIARISTYFEDIKCEELINKIMEYHNDNIIWSYKCMKAHNKDLDIILSSCYKNYIEEWINDINKTLSLVKKCLINSLSINLSCKISIEDIHTFWDDSKQKVNPSYFDTKRPLIFNNLKDCFIKYRPSFNYFDSFIPKSFYEDEEKFKNQRIYSISRRVNNLYRRNAVPINYHKDPSKGDVIKILDEYLLVIKSGLKDKDGDYYLKAIKLYATDKEYDRG